MTPDSTVITSKEKLRAGISDLIPACLFVIYGGPIGTKYDLMGGTVTIGREENNDIILSQTDISRHHARVIMKKSDFLLEDMESTNGTYVNDELITMRHLLNGDLIRMGGVIIKFLKGDNIERLYYEEIYNMTISDGLTGLANRRFLWDFLRREISRSRRHLRPISVLMIDIDHFKQVNDQYGHLAGDFILQQLAKVVGCNIRKEELFARYGGEEFVVVLPECLGDGCRIAAEKLRRLVENTVFTFGEITVPITISIGCATYGDDIESPETFIEQADSNLYKAKRDGRNCIVGP